MARAPSAAASSALPGWLQVGAGVVAFALHASARTAELYLLPALPTTTVVALTLAALVAGGWVGARVPGDRTAWALCAASLAVGAQATLPFSFLGSAWVSGSVFSLALTATTCAAAQATRNAGRFTGALGLVRYATHPLRCLLAGALGLLAAWLGARAGHLRSGLGVAAALSALAAAYPAAYASLHGRPLPGRRALYPVVGASLAALSATLGMAERASPLRELDVYVGEIVHAQDGASHRYVVVASPAGHELFEDAALVSSPLDDALCSRALTAPGRALPAPRRALVLFGGVGHLERALLGDARLESVTSVVADPELPRVARRLPGVGLPTDARLRVVEAEPLPWLLARVPGAAPRTVPGPERYDVVVANLPPPRDHRAGKYYTRFFFETARERLAPGGVLVVPATSALSSRRAFEDVLATARSAGLAVEARHVSLPALGVMSFLVATEEPSAASAPRDLDRGKDLAPRHDGAVARLYDQRVVDAYARDAEP